MGKELHLGVSSITKTVYTGSVGKDGVTWLSNRTDVTNEFLASVPQYFDVNTLVELTRNGNVEHKLFLLDDKVDVIKNEDGSFTIKANDKMPKKEDK